MPNLPAKPKSFVSFYPDEEAQGGVFRQTLVSPLPWGDGRLLRQARELGHKLKAKSFVIFETGGRVWPVEFDDDNA
jgi:hypothetical protein